MAQLLAGGIIALGLFIIAFAIFIASREKKVSLSSTTISQPEAQTIPTRPELHVTEAPALQKSEAQEVAVTENVLPSSQREELTLLAHEGEHASVWWQEQLSSLTAQLQYLREHAKDVERQIAILSEIAALSAELEMIQKKRSMLSEGKISLFPLQVHRQPTDMSYMTDKRPVVRKYTIEAMA